MTTLQQQEQVRIRWPLVFWFLIWSALVFLVGYAFGYAATDSGGSRVSVIEPVDPSQVS